MFWDIKIFYKWSPFKMVHSLNSTPNTEIGLMSRDTCSTFDT